METHALTWGDTVQLRADVGHSRAGAIAEVCGVVVTDTLDHAKSVLGGSPGMTAYLIEFSDGGSLETVAGLLDKV